MSFGDERFCSDLAKILSSEEGINVFRELANYLDFNKLSTVINGTTGELSAYSTAYNESRRGVWLDLREHISRDKLVLIEFPPEKTNKEKPECQDKQQEVMPGHRLAERQMPEQEQAELIHKPKQRSKPYKPQT